MRIAKMADVMGGAKMVEILCPVKGEVMRTLTLVTEGVRPFNSTIHIACPNGETVDVDAETPLGYEPWVFDRGSIIFGNNMKLCTELDNVRFPDGRIESVEPHESIIPQSEPYREGEEPPAVDDSPQGHEMVCSFDDDSVVPNPR